MVAAFFIDFASNKPLIIQEKNKVVSIKMPILRVKNKTITYINDNKTRDRN